MTASGAGVGRARQRTTLFVSRMCPLPLGLVCPRNGITEIDRIGESSELQTLTIRRNAALTRLPVFDRAPAQMVQVTVRDNAALQRGPSFPNLTQLYFFETPYYESAELEFTNNPLLTSIGDYPKLESLTHARAVIEVSRNPSLEGLSLGAAAPGLLRRLQLQENPALAGEDRQRLLDRVDEQTETTLD